MPADDLLDFPQSKIFSEVRLNFRINGVQIAYLMPEKLKNYSVCKIRLGHNKTRGLAKPMLSFWFLGFQIASKMAQVFLYSDTVLKPVRLTI